MPIMPLDVRSLRKQQVAQYNKQWAEKLSLRLDLLDAMSDANAKDPKRFADSFLWPEAGDSTFPRGEQMFWIVNVTHESSVTPRLLQATSLHQLYSAMKNLTYDLDDELDRSFDIHLEGELLTEPMRGYRFHSDKDKEGLPIEFSEWRQLPLCSFYQPGDEINIQLVPRPQRQTDSTDSKGSSNVARSLPFLPLRLVSTWVKRRKKRRK